METDLFVAAVTSYRPCEEGSFEYCLSLVYKMLKWEVHKRYIEFDQLQTDLIDGGYVPSSRLPPKALLGRTLLDKPFLEERCCRLNKWLQALLVRPDTRTSIQVMDFLKFVDHTNISMEPLQLSLLGAVEGGRMSVSALLYCRNNLIVGMEENTNLRTLGKVWSLVESEAIGSVSIYCHGGLASADFVEMTKLCEVALTNRCRALHMDNEGKRVYAGLDDGFAAVLAFFSDGLSLVQADRIELHAGAVVRFGVWNNRLLSLGFDSTMRLLDLSNNRVVSGGRLTKRLNGSYLTCCALMGCYPNDLIALIGTSGGVLLVYSLEKALPVLLESLQVDKHSKISFLSTCDRYETRKGCLSTFFVGHGSTVSCWHLDYTPAPKQKAKLEKRAVLRTATVGSDSPVTCAAYDGAANRLVVGSQNGVLMVWSLNSGMCEIAMDAHGTKVSCILKPNSEQDIYITGGDDGTVKVWRVPSPSDPRLQHWSPPQAGEKGEVAGGLEEGNGEVGLPDRKQDKVGVFRTVAHEGGHLAEPRARVGVTRHQSVRSDKQRIGDGLAVASERSGYCEVDSLGSGRPGFGSTSNNGANGKGVVGMYNQAVGLEPNTLNPMKMHDPLSGEALETINIETDNIGTNEINYRGRSNWENQGDLKQVSEFSMFSGCSQPTSEGDDRQMRQTCTGKETGSGAGKIIGATRGSGGLPIPLSSNDDGDNGGVEDLYGAFS